MFFRNTLKSLQNTVIIDCILLFSASVAKLPAASFVLIPVSEITPSIYLVSHLKNDGNFMLDKGSLWLFSLQFGNWFDWS